MCTYDLPGIQERVYCNTPITDAVPLWMTDMLLDPTWTVTEYYPYFDDNKQPIKPIPGTSIILTLKADGDSDKCIDFSSEFCTLQGKLDPGNAYFGSYKDLTPSSFTIDGYLGQTTIGFGGEIALQEQNYLYNWWERKDLEVKWVVYRNGGSLELTNAATGNLIAVYNQVCMTKEDCVTAATKMGMQVLVGDFPSKGCFMKNDQAFWSSGSTSQISVVGLPGVQMRIFCESATSATKSGGTSTTSEPISSDNVASTVVGNADIDSNMDSTTIDSSKNAGLPPTKLSSTSGADVPTVGGNGAILMIAFLFLSCMGLDFFV